MKVEVKKLESPSIVIKIDGKEYKFTTTEANELADMLNVLLDKGCKGNHYPQIIYVKEPAPLYSPAFPSQPYWGSPWCTTGNILCGGTNQ